MRLHIEGIGLAGPGLPDWASGRAILAEPGAYRPEAVVLKASELLPPAERRRMTDTVKLALTVGCEALAQAGRSADTLPTIFSSSGGDGATISAILEILASPAREVSPTRFHNSVHNAPAGYWSIATHSHETSTSLCAHDHSFGAGLLEAAAQAVHDERPVLLICYDLPYPPVLHQVRPIHAVFGAALLLSPQPTAQSLASLTINLARDGGPETGMTDPDLETLRLGNPTARCLPLFAAIAGGDARAVVLDHMGANQLRIIVTSGSETLQ
jgi:hypothetical protein